jgi:hypothetical protein
MFYRTNPAISLIIDKNVRNICVNTVAEDRQCFRRRKTRFQTPFAIGSSYSMEFLRPMRRSLLVSPRFLDLSGPHIKSEERGKHAH